MASSQFVAQSDNAEMATRLIEDFSKPDSGKMHVYSSARLLQHLVAGQLIRPLTEGCETHELLLLPSQSGKTSRESNVEVVSCICTKCYHHFRIKVIAGSDVPLQKYHTMNMHMFILSGRDSDTLLKATRAGEDHVIDRIHLVCLVEECRCKIELERLPPRLTTRELDALGDKQRVARHLKEARLREFDRVQSLGEDFSPNVFEMLRTYLSDGLGADVNAAPKRIKTHNKRFMVTIKDDFDDLLRTLGCVKTMVEDGDEAWVFPILEPPSSPTAFGTRRAKWEDIEAECMLHLERIASGPRNIRPAWEMLQRVLACNYSHILGTLSLDEADLATLGCLANFNADLFAKAAQLLAARCPSRWDEFKGAAVRLIGNRDQDATEALVMYESTMDPSLDPSVEPSMSSEVADAYRFFDTDKHERNGDLFIAKYYMMHELDPSEPSVLRLLHNLEIVGRFLSTDLVSIVRPSQSSSKMDLNRARSVLDAELNFTEDLWQDIVNHKAQDKTVDRAAVAEALEVFANQHRSSNPQLANKFDNWAGIFKSTNQSIQIDDASQVAQQVSNDPNTPPGLRNIGNTCYLNSLLQYLYTVTSVRDLVLQFPQGSLDLNPESVKQRVLGYANGITFDLDEAIVARQFAEQLKVLYEDLQKTTNVASTPSQKLANTALRSARKLLELEQKAEQPPETAAPPLPARPSPAPPMSQPPDMPNVNITVEPINDAVETASAVSSQTLVEDDVAMPTVTHDGVGAVTGEPQEVKESTSGSDIIMEEAATHVQAELSLEEKIRSISQRLEKSDRKGTDQQDVDEVMGFILEHLMRAIKSIGRMSGNPDMQADIITETFFPLIVNYTLKADEPLEKARAELNSDRWINIIPSSSEGVPSSIHDAIFRSWGVQYPENTNLAVYTAMRKPSPVVHIRIARANEDGSKNSNPIVLTDELYLDRHMDVPPDSEFASIRRSYWALRGHQLQLESINDKRLRPQAPEESQAVAVSAVSQDLPEHALGANDEEATDAILKELPIASGGLSRDRKSSSEDIDGIQSHDGQNGVSLDTGGLMSQVTKILGQTSVVNEYNDDDTVTKEGVEDYFDMLKQHKYRLHAVICHSGGARAGHYWVWIRDFKRDLWIKFNDSTVTVDPREPQDVIDELSMSGDPCYVAYVRDQDKNSIVETPQRTLPLQTEDDVDMQTIEGLAPDDTHMSDLVPLLADKHVVTNHGITEMDGPRPYELD